ncbi:unnamed protein product [Rotaria sp. Silwood1]|nr:unnamed protein product [Rotaria sp. Silwood1]CAF1312064.1 unnamed protein product [Rotaria sp. Silwood1]CAF3523166.1 unnamed protein product [Rotaria sp. Silwood1]CAF4900533.1 unnamed protein product [Rotaria sp. Silwood1]
MMLTGNSYIQFQDLFCVFRGYMSYATCALCNKSFLLQVIYRYFTVVYRNRLYFRSFRFYFLLICLTWIFALLYSIPFVFTVRYVHGMDNHVTHVNILFRAKRELQMVKRIVILITMSVILGFPYASFTLMSFFTSPPKNHFRIVYLIIC